MSLPAVTLAKPDNKLRAETPQKITKREEVTELVDLKAQIKELESKRKEIEEKLIKATRSEIRRLRKRGVFVKSVRFWGEDDASVLVSTANRFSKVNSSHEENLRKTLTKKVFDTFFKTETSYSMRKGASFDELLEELHDVDPEAIRVLLSYFVLLEPLQVVKEAFEIRHLNEEVFDEEHKKELDKVLEELNSKPSVK